MMPYQIDHLDDNVHYSTAFKTFYERLDNLSLYTTALLTRCAQEDDEYDAREDQFFFMRDTCVREKTDQLQRLFDAWQEFFIINIESMKEIRNDTMSEEIDVETARPRVIRSTMGHSTFTELSRLFYLLNRPRLLIVETDEEKVSLKNTKHPLWVSIVNSFDITADYEDKEEADVVVEARLLKMKAMWSRPVMEYTQSDVMDIAFFLTQQLNDVPADCVDEYRAVFERTWLRASILMHEAHPAEVLDDATMRIPLVTDEAEQLFIGNRLFGTFVAMYLGEIMRRLFYYDLLHRKTMTLPAGVITPEMVGRVRAWVTDIIDRMADEAFVETYMDNRVFAYNFVGDQKWFKFSKPTEVMSPQSCLAAFRPHLYRRYFTEDRITKPLLMDSVSTRYTARTYIFKAITMHIQMRMSNTEIKWDQGVVIHSDGIQMSCYMLQSTKCPLLLQVLSSYWCYDDSKMYMTDNIFEALTVWFYLFHTKYNDVLYNHTLEVVVKEVLAIPAQRSVQGRRTAILL